MAEWRAPTCSVFVALPLANPRFGRGGAPEDPLIVKEKIAGSGRQDADRYQASETSVRLTDMVGKPIAKPPLDADAVP